MKLFKKLDRKSIEAMLAITKNAGIGTEIEGEHRSDISWKPDEDSKKRIISDIVTY